MPKTIFWYFFASLSCWFLFFRTFLLSNFFYPLTSSIFLSTIKSVLWHQPGNDQFLCQKLFSTWITIQKKVAEIESGVGPKSNITKLQVGRSFLFTFLCVNLVQFYIEFKIGAIGLSPINAESIESQELDLHTSIHLWNAVCYGRKRYFYLLSKNASYC